MGRLVSIKLSKYYSIGGGGGGGGAGGSGNTESVGKGVYKVNGSALHAANVCLTHEACFFGDIMVPIII